MNTAEKISSPSQALTWFPMRVTYCRELKIKECLDNLKVESYVPMHYELVDVKNQRQLMRVPAIHNLIFVRSTQEALTSMKMTRQELEPLRYMMRPIDDGSRRREIIRIPDKQMEDFIRVSSAEDERVIFLNYSSYLAKPGQRVKVTQGHFAGVEGVIKRINNNKRVVVQIDGVAAVAITYVPTEHLIAINENY